MQKLDWTVWDGELGPVKFGSSEIELVTADGDGNVHIEYFGNFEYEYYKNDAGEIIFIGLSGGTLTDYNAYDDEIIEFSVTDFSFDAVAAFHFMRLGNADPGYNTELLDLILSGDDTIGGSYFNDLLRGFDGNDAMSGGNRDDRLFGDAGKDQLFGDAGNDRLSGGAGTDSLTGGTGKDQLVGGAGNDVFIYNTKADGGDNIGNFVSGGTGGDTLEFAATGFGLPNGSLIAGQFQRGPNDDAGSQNVRFIYNTQTGDLFFDNDGSGGDKAVLIATLAGHPQLVLSDFIIV